MRLSGQFVYFLFMKIFCIKKTHKLCSNISIRLKSIIKHTSNFHLDITPRSIKNKQTTIRLNIFICLKKHTSNFHLDIMPRSIKNFHLEIVQDVMNNVSLRYMLKDSWYKM